MYYQKFTNLEYVKDPDADKYPDRELKDVVPAAYHNEYNFSGEPDICALPKALTIRELIKTNTSLIPTQSYSDYSCSERMEFARRIKDNVRFFLPYQRDIEAGIRSCLISAYSSREYGTRACDTDIYSVKKTISGSARNISVVGVAGSGKSTAVGLAVKKYPRAIRHVFPDGHGYIQIPIICTTGRAKDLKSLYLDIARKIDHIQETDAYEKDMITAGSISRMGLTLVKLVEKFHIGMIVIDEIQLMKRKKGVFEEFLSTSSLANVALCLIGTEEALSAFSSEEWFDRRFNQLGMVRAEMDVCCNNSGNEEEILNKTDKCLKKAIELLFTMQFTNTPVKCTERIMAELIRLSRGNIDFLTTLYVTAQHLAIKAEANGESVPPMIELIRKAASCYPKAALLIQKGESGMEEEVFREKNAKMMEMVAESETIAKAEVEIAVDAEYKEAILRSRALAEVETRLKAVGYSRADITKTFDRLWNEDTDFHSLPVTLKCKILNKELQKK